jgi:hypothetical protein
MEKTPDQKAVILRMEIKPHAKRFCGKRKRHNASDIVSPIL